MNDIYSYILADLLKRNTELHGKEIKKHGQKVKWPDETRKICLQELRKIATNGALIGLCGLIWNRLRQQNVTTRCIYQLLLQWALLLTEKSLLNFYTTGYENLMHELQCTIESGAEGTVEDIPSQEIIEEWEFMTQFLPDLHQYAENFENNHKKGKYA